MVWRSTCLFATVEAFRFELDTHVFGLYPVVDGLDRRGFSRALRA